MSGTTSPGLARFRMILWGLVVIAAIGATAIFFLRPPGAPLAVTGTPFALQSTQGGTFTEADLTGKPSLVFFGYTFCPDVCPTTLAESVAWKQALGLDQNDLRTIFITVDPERDTLPAVTEYLSGFDPSVIGLVGDAEQTEAAKKAFGAFSQKASEDEFYLVDHTALVFLVGADGRFKGTIAYEENTDTALGKIRRLTGA